MKRRMIESAASFYPAEWRERYGAEFAALLDDAPLRWSDVADVMRGAAIMQITTWSYWKTGLLAGIAGLILVGGYSFTIPDQYVCTAAMVMEGASGNQLAQLGNFTMSLLGRDNLIMLIQNPSLNLYSKERQRYPIGDVAENIFRKHLRVVPYEWGMGGQAFRIVFEYPDKNTARAVVAKLVSEYMTGPNATIILEHPITPEKPTSPLRLAYVIVGALSGSLFGLVSLAIYRRTRTYAVVTVNIPRESKEFVQSRIAAGPYRDLSDYVRELIRADQEKQQ